MKGWSAYAANRSRPTAAELKGLLDATGSQAPLNCRTDAACIHPTFGPTLAFPYWSATRTDAASTSAVVVDFQHGFVTSQDARVRFPVRAVRGGR